MPFKPKVKLGRFLLEILSIFIAISAAFWLEDWNRIRLEKKEEIKVLKELKNGLLLDISDMESNHRGHGESIFSSIRLTQFFNGTLDSTNTIVDDFHVALIDYTFTPNTGAFETLKSKGFRLISNDSLRMGIVSLYDFDFPAMVQMEENEDAFEFNQNYGPAVMERLAKMNLSYWGGNNRIRSISYPSNYRERQDHAFMVLTDRMIHQRIIIMGFYDRKTTKARNLVGQIDAELARLE